jgi:molybdopterin converting factor small subunit
MVFLRLERPVWVWDGHLSCYHFLESSLAFMHVEFLGVPRQRAGIPKLEVQADTLGQLLEALAVQIPSLGEIIAIDRLQSSFVANLNGDRFINDPVTPLGQDDCVLILSADAGG